MAKKVRTLWASDADALLIECMCEAYLTAYAQFWAYTVKKMKVGGVQCDVDGCQDRSVVIDAWGALHKKTRAMGRYNQPATSWANKPMVKKPSGPLVANKSGSGSKVKAK